MNNKIIVSRKRSYERFYIKNIIYLVMYNNIIVNDKSFNLANSYDKYDNVETIHIEKEDEDYYYVEATVNVLGRIGICWFCYDSNYKIFDYDCDCEWCNNNSPCGHIGAVLLKLNDLDI